MRCSVQRFWNMSDFFRNVWTKRVVSLLSPLYCVLVAYFSYMSVFYELEVKDGSQVCLLVSAVSVVALIIMLYTRNQFLTKLTSILLLPCLLLPVLLFFGEWGVLVPPFVTGVIIFFFSGLSETGKTIWGTVVLLLYLIGSLAYFMMTSMFAPSTVTTVVESGTSPTGRYRYAVTETVDSSDGSTKVTIETTEHDIDYDLVLFHIRSLERDVKIERPLNSDVTIRWEKQNREDITKELHALSKDIEITFTDSQMELLGKPAYQLNYKDGRSATLMPEQYHSIIVPLSVEEKALLQTEKESLRLDSMSSRAMETLGIEIVDLRTMKLTDLSDEELVILGVPEEGDVMYYNDKCVFRYYIAILEQYFDISKQDFGLF